MPIVLPIPSLSSSKYVQQWDNALSDTDRGGEKGQLLRFWMKEPPQRVTYTLLPRSCSPHNVLHSPGKVRGKFNFVDGTWSSITAGRQTQGNFWLANKSVGVTWAWSDVMWAQSDVVWTWIEVMWVWIDVMWAQSNVVWTSSDVNVHLEHLNDTVTLEVGPG